MKKLLEEYKGKFSLIIIAYFAMIIFGLLEALKGAVIPSIRNEFGVDYSYIGVMLFVALLGYLISTFVAGFAAEKYGLKKLFIFGILLVSTSTLLFNVVRSFNGVIVIYFLLGLGLGCFEIGVNVLGSKTFIKNEAMMMNLVHLFFGLGATLAPRYAAIFINNNYSWQYSYLLTIVLTIILLLLVLFTNFPESSSDDLEDKISFKVVIKSPKIWLIAISLGLFVAIESGISNWLINYLQINRSLSVTASTSYLTYFFGLFTIGRLVGGSFADKVGFIKSLIYFTFIATILLLLGIVLDDKFLWLFSITGFFISIMFPTMMALIMTQFHVGTGTIMGFAITVSGLINMTSGWLLGIVNDYFGVIGGMFYIVLFGLIATILLIVLKRMSNI